MFWEKAVAGWINRGDVGRVGLVCDYIKSVMYVDSTTGQKVPGFRIPPTVVSSEPSALPDANILDRVLGVLQRATGSMGEQDPFFAVIGYKQSTN